MTEIRILVDECDHIIGYAPIDSVYQENLLHRGAATMVLNSSGEIFVHRRAFHQCVYSGYYALFAGGGVMKGETYKQGALRELREELGIRGAQLQKLFTLRYKNSVNNNFTRFYLCKYDGHIRLQQSELQWGAFVSPVRLKKLLKTKRFAPDDVRGFRKYLSDWRTYG